MTALFVALGITMTTLLALLLWFVPHLLHQQALRSTQEAAKLRKMLLEMLNEQERVTQRQAQLSRAMTHLQGQLERVVRSAPPAFPQQLGATVDAQTLNLLEERMGTMQKQIQIWLDTRMQAQRNAVYQDNEAWANLISLLAAMQERVGALSGVHAHAHVGMQAQVLVEELEHEMDRLRTVSDDIATLQWRLRRSLTEREQTPTGLRVKPGGHGG